MKTAEVDVGCEGSCASQHWPDLDDFGHKPPRGRWKHPATGSGNHTRKGRHRRKGTGSSSGEYVAKWTEGLQLEAEYNSSLSLRDACAVFFADEFSSYRSQFISRAGAAALLLSFDEYKISSVRATTVRPERADDAPLLSTCERRPLGIGIPFSRNNIWHQAFHAIPAWEALRGEVARARAQGVAPTFVPLVLPKAGLGRYHSQHPASWFAWEFTLRPLSPLSASEIAAQTAALLAAPCVCFDRVEARHAVHGVMRMHGVMHGVPECTMQCTIYNARVTPLLQSAPGGGGPALQPACTRLRHAATGIHARGRGDGRGCGRGDGGGSGSGG